MQAILLSKHHNFCEWLEEIKGEGPVNIEDINMMETELHLLYEAYRLRMNDIKQIIDSYEKTQRAIRIKLKESRRISKEGKQNI